jgi:hypothetical protein
MAPRVMATIRTVVMMEAIMRFMSLSRCRRIAQWR